MYTFVTNRFLRLSGAFYSCSCGLAVTLWGWILNPSQAATKLWLVLWVVVANKIVSIQNCIVLGPSKNSLRKMSSLPKSNILHVKNEKLPSGVYLAAYRRWANGVRDTSLWLRVTSERAV